jgi:hypothetical protein
MASANTPTQAPPEATQQDGRARSQVEGNGERTAVPQPETRARSEERPAARGTHALSTARPARDRLTGAGGPLEAMWSDAAALKLCRSTARTSRFMLSNRSIVMIS